MSSIDLTVHDRDRKLIWTRDSNLPAQKLNWSDANAFIQKMNRQNYAGRNDWRLPTFEEMSYLRAFASPAYYPKPQDDRGSKEVILGDNKFRGSVATTFNNMGFRDVKDDAAFWLSSNYLLSADMFSMDNGWVLDKMFKKIAKALVWPVRTDQ
ncbi:MAG: DUF1566 domain-containing protein [Nitrospirota bacterium]